MSYEPKQPEQVSSYPMSAPSPPPPGYAQQQHQPTYVSPPISPQPTNGWQQAFVQPMPLQQQQQQHPYAMAQVQGGMPPLQQTMSHPQSPPPMMQQQHPYAVQQPQQQQQQRPPVQQTFMHTTALGNLNSGPAPVLCPACGQQAMTSTQLVSGSTTHAWALGFCLVTLLGCIPYLISGTKDVVHKCGKCGAQLATWHRSGRVVQHMYA